MFIKKARATISLITKIAAFTYVLELMHGQLSWMREKPIILQIAPLIIAFVICALCEE